MKNLNELLDLELNYKHGNISLKKFGKVNVKINYNEFGNINTSIPGKESNYQSVDKSWKNKYNDVDIGPFMDYYFDLNEGIKIKNIYVKETFTRKAEVGFCLEKTENEQGQRETITKQNVQIISKKRLTKLLK